MKKYLIYILFILAVISTFAFSGCGKRKVPVSATPQPVKEEVVQQGEELPPPKEDVIKKAKLTVTGDLMVHSWQYNEAYNKETGAYDFSHNFSEIKKYFTESDLVIGNLETVFAGEDKGISDYPSFNTPDSFAKALKEAGFNLLTTANNHCMDKGTDGLNRTIKVLDDLGIDHFGTYLSKEQRDSILVKDVNGIKIAFLSYTYGTNGIPVSSEYSVNRIDGGNMEADISRAKGMADLVVVMPHMGTEYEETVRDEYKALADKMFDAGADIILASHPHVLQPMEYRTITNPDGTTRDGFIIYSLGNCISSQTTPPRNAGVILNLEIQQLNDDKPEIKQVSVIPIWTQFRNVKEEDHFIVRSVYDMLSLSDDELKATVRAKDIKRLKEIQVQSTKTLLGYEVPIEEIKPEYIFER
ncbi:MAG: CapA family protein [Lachnospiraceae bacterium]|nr:CapA family protein [Lachnospiraceae bacterium]